PMADPTTVGLFNPVSGRFYLKNTHSGGPADVIIRVGPAGSNWIPITGDWDGDGDVTVGLFNPVSGRFYLKNTHSGGPADVIIRFGPAGSNWTPLAGDWTQ
ncbi:MAG: hypothetical protein VX681_06960, partial [Myxococcota bacterium]|nr:hypothetical protein [Myxococcota bacterium]